ncbi:heme-binding protein [Lichenicola cladoniae]|uniref:Heme-binding protein n=1 Tax=Lichenicola cladoniae TaxID=1484109 RepID=A0A6M8HRE1_9PROT|nr:heme-binding protein [Lichenicola cladoniae]NPD69083.1 heme-binding protein [Acetobacteraceae bacterium]QKE90908.1 heme-binding protein [Lichenicola cladoniae]
MKLDRSDAHHLIEEAVIQANILGRPMCVAVTDERGALLAFSRMDGAPVRSIKLSEAKAYSAARLGVTTTAFHARLVREGVQASYFADSTLTGLPGGAVICSQSGAIIGGIGISGLAPVEDQQIADEVAAALARNMGDKT